MLGVSFFLTDRANAQVADRAAALHEICRAAAETPNAAVVTNSDTQCVFRTVVGAGTSTYYNYFSGDDFCVRTIVVMPDAPKYDRTICNPVNIPANSSAENEDLAQAKILAGLEGVDEAVRLVGEKVDYIEGTVKMVRNGGTSIVTSDLQMEPGDVILTGKTGFVEIISSGSSTWLSGDSTLGYAEIGPTEKPRVIAPDEPLDPQNFQLEELSWWQKVGLYFAGTYNPDVYKTAEMYGPKKARIVYRGAAYFDEKTDGSVQPPMVVTPTAAIVPNGTAFLVEVEKDGATTVTTLDGKVLVADLISGKVVSVAENQAVTVPKTVKGLSAKELLQSVTTTLLKPIDRWWLEKITARVQQSAAEAARAGGQDDHAANARNNKIFFGSLAILFIVGLVISAVVRARASRKK